MRAFDVDSQTPKEQVTIKQSKEAFIVATNLLRVIQRKYGGKGRWDVARKIPPHLPILTSRLEKQEDEVPDILKFPDMPPFSLSTRAQQMTFY
jgi:hypothetical protein